MPALKRSMDSPSIAPLLGNIMKSSDEAAGIGKKVVKGGDEAGKSISANTGKINIDLKYKEEWTATQKAEADAKVKALTEYTTIKTMPSRSGTSASSRYKKAHRQNSIPYGKDIDHTIDLQLGGADNIFNMHPLDSSVNRSLGKQIQFKIKDYPFETIFDKFIIK